MAKKQEFLTCQRILKLMVILYFMLNYMLRINISIAIVDMTAKNESENMSHRFDWDENKKNDILGVLFWGFFFTSIPGGRLSEIYGTRIVLGLTMLVASLATLFTPLACNCGYYFAVAIRFILGLAIGVAWPAVPPMAVKWFAKESRHKFMAHTIASSLGAAITLPGSSYLIAYMGWPSVFYVTGATSLAWTFFWFYLIYDSPEQHPRISDIEKEKIATKIGSQEHSSINNIPWSKLLTSRPAWAVFVGTACSFYGINTIIVQLPSYMNQVLSFQIKENGLLSSLPFFGSYLSSIAATYFAVVLIKKTSISTLAIRKIFTTIALALTALLFLAQSFWGYSRIVSLIVFMLSVSFMSFIMPGCFSSAMDISPAYSGTIIGIGFTLGSVISYALTKIIAKLTEKDQTFEQWRYVFAIFAVGNLVSWIIYLCLASAKVQNWNPRNRIPSDSLINKDVDDATVAPVNQPLQSSA